ncbi:MAG: carbohydrate binding domain-containing protein, partial [Prevotella sp.]|nr:carbohydrate binding domain-containing protein [Prevotella sp.]
MKLKLFSCTLLLAGTLTAQAQHVMDVNTKKLGAAVQPTMYGIFFEDINYAADGGLYAEMVKNRSFEFPERLMGWRAFGRFEVRDDGPFDRNPHYVRLRYSGHNDKFTGLENEGFFGIATFRDATYRFSVWARCPEGGSSTLEVSFVDNDTMGEDQRFATAKVEVSGKEWKKYTAELKSPRTEPKGALRIFLAGRKATTDVEHISLFPTDTWKGRENGMRRDLAQALADMH